MKIGIIGGGITGLTTALALRKLGVSSVVYEQARELNEVGAGIWLQPNAIQILDWLEVKDDIKSQGRELKKAEITDRQLTPIRKIRSEVAQDEYGNRAIAIHRARLQKILYSEVLKTNEVHLDRKYMRHHLNAEAINLQFEHDEDVVDVLLGADGIDSAVRKRLFPNSSLRNSRQVCWRGVSKMNLPESSMNIGQEAWGRKTRFGFSQIYDDEVYWFAVANEEHLVEVNGVDRKKYIAGLFQDFSPLIAELIAYTESTNIHQATLHDLKRLPFWYKDNVCLIGDAAHATTPNMGQGACQGIEDAYYISKCLSRSLPNAREAFHDFQDKRRKKVDYIVNTSWQFGQMAHSIIGQSFLKLVIKMTPESVFNSQMNKLYSVGN